MSVYTCDDRSCALFERQQSFDYSFSCQRAMSSFGVPCKARELDISQPGRSQTAPTIAAGDWGVERSRASEDTAYAPHERDTEYASGERSPLPPPAPPPPPERRGISAAAILLPILLLLVVAGGIGAYVLRDRLFGDAASADGGTEMTEQRLLATVLRAAYAREISDKILSVRRQIEAIRQRDEASSPEMAREIAEIESRLSINEAERRAAFADCAAEIERLGKQPRKDVDDAVDELGKRFDQSGLKRLKALLPVVDAQIGDARAGKIDHDRWISQIEVASL